MKVFKEKIAEIYKRRQKAHDELLACDIEIDKILKDLVKQILNKAKEER